MFKPDPRILAQFHQKVATPELRTMQLEQMNNIFKLPGFKGLNQSERNRIANSVLGEMARKKMLLETGHLEQRIRKLASRPKASLTSQKKGEIAEFFRIKTGKPTATDLIRLNNRRKIP